MRRLRATIVILLASAWAAGCGAGTGANPVAPIPSTGTSAQLLPPTVFIVPAQRVNADSNTVTFTWLSSEATFQLIIGTSSGASDVLSTVVTGNTFTWTSPRIARAYYARVAAKRGEATSGFSDEQTITVVDVRNMIEAMYFHTGPMADGRENGNTRAGIWADGTRLRVVVSSDAGELARSTAQTFADQYAALVGGVITATAEMTSDRMQTPGNFPQSALPEFTIGIRQLAGFCGDGALACANYGPDPLGANRATITLELPGGLNQSATAHEMGHAYGIGHVQTPVTGRPEFRFMMNSSASSEQMTDAEKLAITLARAGGLRAGATRALAVSLGLVNQ